MKKVRIVLYSITFLVFVSCTIQKRLYRNGYYIEGLKNKKKHTELYTNVSPLSIHHWKKNIEQNTIASNSNHLFHFKKQLKTSDDPCADTLIFKSGEILVVKILEISETTIKYKKCDYLNGPTYSISKNKIYLIKYGNGTQEHILPDSETNLDEKDEKINDEEPNFDYGYNKKHEPSIPPGNRRTHPDALISIFSLLGGFAILFSEITIGFIFGNVLLVVALFSARHAVRESVLHPELYKGQGFARAMMYINLIVWTLLFVISLAALQYIPANIPNYSLIFNLMIGYIIFQLIVLLIFFITSKKIDF
ncbi:MAG: hypothetical protein KatS3mg027_2136 [Bacteroidia bacterium]|nr:MAG: hypothetical protein KatS3mg027_2136 [Bacteroidia bacterium]